MTPDWSVEPFELPGVFKHTLTVESDSAEGSWNVSVALPPPGVQKEFGPGPYPALYVMDGLFTFVTAMQITRTISTFSLGQLAPVVVVGITPATDDLEVLLAQRNRDLTPSTAERPGPAGTTQFGTGGASAMLELLTGVMVPYLESAYPLDPGDRGLAGMSLGGLFVCWTLVAAPQGFRRFLAVSPSLWWDDQILLDESRMPSIAGTVRHVYLAVGELEDDPTRSWPVPPDDLLEAAAGIDMVADLAGFTERLHGESSIDLRSEVIADEQHSTIWPAAFTRGLVHLYRKASPRLVRGRSHLS